MFGLSDLIAVVISAFIILPVVIFIRELGYLPVTLFLGVKNPRLTVGSGPRIAKFGVFDIRKYYHLYSWFSFDDIRRKNNLNYILIYASPIIANTIVAVGLNTLIANGFFEEQARFWNRFVFYAVFYVLFDSIPMIMNNGKPNNGMIIYELIRYGKRVDHNKDNLIPTTKQMEEDYQNEMKEIEKAQQKLENEKKNPSEAEQHEVEREVVQDEILEEKKETAKEEIDNDIKKQQDENKEEGD